MKRERFNNKWHDYCTFCDMYKELIWIVIQGIITSGTIQPMTDWRVTTPTPFIIFLDGLPNHQLLTIHWQISWLAAPEPGLMPESLSSEEYPRYLLLIAIKVLNEWMNEKYISLKSKNFYKWERMCHAFKCIRLRNICKL